MKNQLDSTKIKRALKIDAIGLGIPTGAAEIFADKALDAALKKINQKKIVTEKDLNLALSRELKKYNPDLAYVYKNRDTII